MASTIDFSSFDDQDLLYGYQRVNRARFPENFVACAEEIAKRGLPAPEKFEISAIQVESVFQKIGDSLSTVANLFTKKSVETI